MPPSLWEGRAEGRSYASHPLDFLRAGFSPRASQHHFNSFRRHLRCDVANEFQFSKSWKFVDWQSPNHHLRALWIQDDLEAEFP